MFIHSNCCMISFFVFNILILLISILFIELWGLFIINNIVFVCNYYKHWCLSINNTLFLCVILLILEDCASHRGCTFYCMRVIEEVVVFSDIFRISRFLELLLDFEMRAYKVDNSKKFLILIKYVVFMFKKWYYQTHSSE